MLRILTLATLTSITLSACNHNVPMLNQVNSVKTQAFIPPSDRPIKPCGFSTQAALPPGYNPQKPVPCTCRQSIQAQAALPPDYSPQKPICSK